MLAPELESRDCPGVSTSDLKVIKMGKTKCKEKKEAEKEVKDPKYQCRKCGEVARKEKKLCKPEKL